MPMHLCICDGMMLCKLDREEQLYLSIVIIALGVVALGMVVILYAD